MILFNIWNTHVKIETERIMMKRVQVWCLRMFHKITSNLFHSNASHSSSRVALRERRFLSTTSEPESLESRKRFLRDRRFHPTRYSAYENHVVNVAPCYCTTGSPCESKPR